MTKEQTKKAIAVMQAFVDGKRIEFAGDYSTWREAGDPNWCWSGSASTYRVKPEPKLRPWTPVEAAAYLGRSVRSNSGSFQFVLASLNLEGFVSKSGCGLPFQHLADEYTLEPDGQPCGVREEPK
jgi:hypothetical protein